MYVTAMMVVTVMLPSVRDDNDGSYGGAAECT